MIILKILGIVAIIIIGAWLRDWVYKNRFK